MTAAAHTGMNRRAGTARRKGRGHTGPTMQKRRRKGPECSNGIRDRDLREQLRQSKGKEPPIPTGQEAVWVP
jgi:hypothetical protein